MAKTKLPELRIEPVEKGFIVHHSMDPDTLKGPYKAPTKHLFTDAPSMLHHVATTLAPRKSQSFKDALTELKGSSE